MHQYEVIITRGHFDRDVEVQAGVSFDTLDAAIDHEHALADGLLEDGYHWDGGSQFNNQAETRWATLDIYKRLPGTSKPLRLVTILDGEEVWEQA